LGVDILKLDFYWIGTERATELAVDDDDFLVINEAVFFAPENNSLEWWELF